MLFGAVSYSLSIGVEKREALPPFRGYLGLAFHQYILNPYVYKNIFCKREIYNCCYTFSSYHSD
jgi:hypothetical protein